MISIILIINLLHYLIIMLLLVKKKKRKNVHNNLTGIVYNRYISNIRVRKCNK